MRSVMTCSAAGIVLFAAPAAAQEIRGCSSVPGPSVATTLDATKLVADIACFATLSDLPQRPLVGQIGGQHRHARHAGQVAFQGRS